MQIVRYLEDYSQIGGTIEDAAELLRVPKSCLQRWVKKKDEYMKKSYDKVLAKNQKIKTCLVRRTRC